MSVGKCLKHGKPYPCGKCRIESKGKPPQTPPIPIYQLLPTARQEAATKENLHMATVWHIRRGKKPASHVVSSPWAAAKDKKLSMREKSGLTRRDISQLLLNPEITAAIAPHEVTQYKRLAAGNVSEEDLAQELGLRDTAGLGAYLEGLEKPILRKALFLRIPISPQSPEPRSLSDSDELAAGMDSSEAAENAIIIRTGGESIDGRIVGAGSRATNDGEKTLHLKSFEGSGRNLILSGSPEADTEESTHGAVEDDYSDESGA
jgi:hypothetical protein